MTRAQRRFFSLLAACGLAGTAACDGSTGPDTLLPPANVAALPDGPRSVTLSFQAVTGATGYVIERAPQGGDFAELATVGATTYRDTAGLAPQTTYRYRVAATNASGRSGYSFEEIVTTAALASRTVSNDITANTRFHADTVYTLGGFVHVTNGATLSIDAGTRIQGLPQSALFIMRGAKILAVGTAERPIVMTSAQPVGQRKPGDWGGLIIIGNGVVNRVGPIELEGAGTDRRTPPVSGSNYPVSYGHPAGTAGNNADDSGELRYVLVEFAGFGPAQDQELNTFTFAGVGSGTRLSHLHALAGLDDHYEWFGGAVDAKYLVSYESGDDHFDMSEGYVGRLQHLIAYQGTFLEPRQGAGNNSTDPQGIENDGCAGAGCPNGQLSQPYTIPLVANFTLIGTGTNVTTPPGGGRGMMLRRGTGGYYVNGVVARWPNFGVTLRDPATKDRIDAGDLVLRNLLFADNGATFEPDNPASTTRHYTVDAAANALETVQSGAAALFTALPATPAGAASFDWTPSASSPARTGGLTTFPAQVAARAGSYVTPTAYRGAADPNGPKWWEGWTTYARN
jgi:hypothetical protein